MKVTAFVHASYDSYKKKFVYQTWPHKSDGIFGVFIGEIEFDAPDVDEGELKNGTVKAMKSEQQKIRAEAEVKIQNIEQQIGELLCIEDKSNG